MYQLQFVTMLNHCKPRNNLNLESANWCYYMAHFLHGPVDIVERSHFKFVVVLPACIAIKLGSPSGGKEKTFHLVTGTGWSIWLMRGKRVVHSIRAAAPYQAVIKSERQLYAEWSLKTVCSHRLCYRASKSQVLQALASFWHLIQYRRDVSNILKQNFEAGNFWFPNFSLRMLLIVRCEVRICHLASLHS